MINTKEGELDKYQNTESLNRFKHDERTIGYEDAKKKYFIQ